jgi:hypothetical protein
VPTTTGALTSLLRTRDVAAYLRVSHQRAAQMYDAGKLPKPYRVDGIGSSLTPEGTPGST